MKIKDVMSKKIVCCNFDDTIYDASIIMKKYDIGFIPIVKDKKIVGTITDRDIVVNNIYDKTENINIMMSNDIKTINVESNLEDALELMKKYKIKRLIVTDNNKAKGIISLSDIVGKIDNDKFVNTFKTIYEIDKNEHDYDVEVDEFYL